MNIARTIVGTDPFQRPVIPSDLLTFCRVSNTFLYPFFLSGGAILSPCNRIKLKSTGLAKKAPIAPAAELFTNFSQNGLGLPL